MAFTNNTNNTIKSKLFLQQIIISKVLVKNGLKGGKEENNHKFNNNNLEILG